MHPILSPAEWLKTQTFDPLKQSLYELMREYAEYAVDQARMNLKTNI